MVISQMACLTRDVSTTFSDVPDKALGQRVSEVCILVAKPILCVNVDTHTKYPTLELCCVDLVDKSQKCRLFVVYSKPANAKLKASYISELIKCFHDFDKVSWPVETKLSQYNDGLLNECLDYHHTVMKHVWLC